MASPLPFTHLGRYRILRELGRGAMGVVYLAEDESLQRQVAIKTLLLPEGAKEGRELEARFRQEATAAGGVSHPNTITIHDFGREGNWLYIAMERLQGVELRELMEGGPLPLEGALDIAAQVAAGLAAAHERGVVHRDVKPGNIMVLPGGLAKIMDFGIAHVKSSDVRTATGTMMGSPRYMSPEQVGGHLVDPRSDIFSLGSLLYEMVTGQAAFQGANLGQLLAAIRHGAPVPPSQLRAGLPASIELVITRAMQKNPRSRYQDAGEMARDLAQCRALLGRPGAVRVAAPAADPQAATSPAAPTPLDVDLTLPLGAPGWPLAAGFDSNVGWRALAEGRAAPSGPQGPSWSATAWTCGYLLAAGVALLLAFA
ncbi:MAG TPA: serine/threonine-protein kinase [Ramlibacter sp.]|uniref:serine/threonine-protein kinase n=1 Tax=Ramlibacter sp. TaxID=1917967 RepID=UPI002D7E73B2|nr:serine/threonine-protein kinase [Ramlibacter sp.]HET8747060.1 serine/threonine-protein kinase [Ramlibacter sp.]